MSYPQSENLPMATAKELEKYTRKQLAQVAKHNKVLGWHGMLKVDLIKALKNRPLVKFPPKAPPVKELERNQTLKSDQTDSSHVPLHQTPDEILLDFSNVQRTRKLSRPARLQATATEQEKDILSTTAQGPFWLYAEWQLTPQTLERAEAALGKEWHQAVPVLHLVDVDCEDGACPTISCVDTIFIQNPVEEWHIPVPVPGKTYELHLGYQSTKGQFFTLVRSSAVKTPLPGSPQAQKYEEQRQKNGLNSARAENAHRFPLRGAAEFRFAKEVSLQVDADIVVYGQVSPGTYLTCEGEIVTLLPDGSFELRLHLEEGRQLIQLEATSSDGCQKKTAILAIDRNTKYLDLEQLNDWDY